MTTKYNENFQLNPKDIELIEEALRTSLEHLAHDTMMIGDAIDASDKELVASKNTKVKQVNQLLGKLHNKNIFYSQTHRKEGVPLG